MNLSRDALVVVALVLCLGITLVNLAKHNDILDHLERGQEDSETMKLTSTWTSEGVTHALTSSRLEGQTVEAFAQTHKEAVDALKAVFPPDPPPGE